MTKIKDKPYYTDCRARRAINLSDTSGQNSISYDEDTGVLSFTGLSDILTLNPVSEPVSPVNGNIAMADGSTWNPNADGTQALMIYINGAWSKII